MSDSPLVEVVHPEVGTAMVPDDPGHLRVLAQSGWRRADQTADSGERAAGPDETADGIQADGPAPKAKRRKAPPQPTSPASPQED